MSYNLNLKVIYKHIVPNRAIYPNCSFSAPKIYRIKFSAKLCNQPKFLTIRCFDYIGFCRENYFENNLKIKM